MVEIERKSKGRDVAFREFARRVFRHENAVLAIILVVIIAVLAVMSKGRTVSAQNVSNVVLQSSMLGIASVGQTFVILSGGIDLSLGGIGLMSAVLGGTLMTTDPTTSLLGYPLAIGMAIPIMLLLGTGIGSANGMAVRSIGMPPLIVTLAMLEMTTGGAYLLSHGYFITDLPRALSFFGQAEVAGIPVPTIMFIAVAAVSYFVLYYTTFGRCVYATGGNPVSAWLSGVNVKRTQFSVYAIAGFLAALSAVVAIGRTLSASMVALTGLELHSIAAVVIGGVSLMGGRGTLIGAVIGVIILGVISNGMNILAVDPAFTHVIEGGIVFAAVAVDYTRRRG